MSEPIDVDADNICAAEDAFEQFQAVSMYEENEYITLSDIVSPPPPSDIPIDVPTDDVCPLLTVEEPLNQVTSTTDQNSQETTPKKRGRKKKIILESTNNCPVSGPREIKKCKVLTDNENDKSNVSSQSLELSLDNSTSNAGQASPETPHDTTLSHEIPPSYKRGRYNRRTINKKPILQKIGKKRGRKPKNIQVPTSSSNNDKNDNLTDKVNISDINKPLLASNTNKRGRRKKRIPSELIEFSNEVVIEPETDVQLAPDKEASLPNENVVKRQTRGRKPKKDNSLNTSIFDKQLKINETLGEQQKSENEGVIPNEPTDDEIEDMPLVALSNKIGKLRKTDPSDVQLLSETKNDLLKEIPSEERKQIIDNHKTPRKRGRPKKIVSNNSACITSENENDISTTNSIVKEHIDSKECISEVKANVNNSECSENNIDDIATIQESQESIHNESHNKRSSKKPIMSDFEYNIDSIIKSDNQDDNIAQQFDHSESSTTDSSKRPVRRKVKKNLHYDEGSDEDPYANIELSDDEPRRRKGGRYNSDDEYIPGDKRQLSDLSDDSDIDIDEDMQNLLGESTKQNSRKYKRSESGSVKSPRKKAKKGDQTNSLDIFTQKPTTMDGDGDLEDLLETSVIKTSEDTPKSWGSTKEFKDFLVKISQGTDIKIKKARSIDNSKTTLQIPVLDQKDTKKTTEMCAQTDTIKTKAISVQTSSVHEVPMKNQVALTANQAEKACEFLSGIVKTTAELGQLMTQKSEDFINKKINTTYVTDTLKMDYCVKKSFLLFRLAKHNLVQMEEDLAKQYEEFLKENNLIEHREEQKIIEPTSKAANSDSDCEIVEEPVLKDKEVKQAFNPKTVFLNKELSIKIAKKPSEEPKPKEKLNIKGRHTVWINDSIMVKKVKPTQSFLAQDSRNKKPPDTYVTLEMVSDFFKMYNRQKALSICTQFIRPDWLNMKQFHTCCYFFDKTCESPESSIANIDEITTEVTITENSSQNPNDTKLLNKICPNSLLTLCTEVIQKMMSVDRLVINNKWSLPINIEPRINNSYMLVNTCEDETKDAKHLSDLHNDNKNGLSVNIGHLKTLCYKKLIELICVPDFSESNVKKVLSYNSTNNTIYEINEDTYSEKPEYNAVIEKVKPLFSLCLNIIIQDSQEALETSNLVDKEIKFQPLLLKCIVFNKVRNLFSKNICKINKTEEKVNTVTEICLDLTPTTLKQNNDNILDNLKLYFPVPLKSLCIDVINDHIFDRLKQSSPISLKSLCVDVMNKTFNKHCKDNPEINGESHIGTLNFTINNVNTVSEDMFLNDTDEDYNEDNQIESTYLDGEEHVFSDDCEANYDNNFADDDNNWVSQVQMKELRSFVEPTNNNDSKKSLQVSDLLPNGTVNIKMEPIDELSDNIIEANIKTEPTDEEETTFTPLVVTKQEHIDATSSAEHIDAAASSKEPVQRQNSNSYDENTFEDFVSTNKMILSLNSYDTTYDEVFTQSTSRVRRQYEPDSDSESENLTDCLNLLVPQNIETAKDRLMESSSDEDTNKKKKPEKRGRGRPKRNTKINNVLSVKENLASKSELAVLTRKMREKIRQVEKQNETSESELDDTVLSVIKDKVQVKDKSQKKQLSDNNVPEKEIQCNDVDSTEQINENDVQLNENGDNQSSVYDESDKAALSCDKKQTQYDDDSQLADMDDRSNSPLINADEPVELLECEPTMPMFENLMEKPHTRKKPKLKEGFNAPGPASSKNKKIPSYIDRHGWDCYPIDTKDTKIYQHAQIMLHKLPESFVETYLKYQDLSEQSKDDTEVDKLINLQSLHRIQSKEKGCLKVKDGKNASSEHNKLKSLGVETVLQREIKVEQCEELLPSDDEGENTEDIPVISQPSTENYLAKDFLMNDDEESDLEKPIGERRTDKSPKKDLDETGPKKAGRFSKCKVEEGKLKTKNENLMLTADKMMTKELAMLHAPVDLKQELPDVKDIVTRSSTKNATKTSPKTHSVKEQKDKDDSSSEEEKQWFTTKEKLLKRLEKKQECPSVDDAKRAKIVSEFIEKRSDGPQIRLRGRPPRRRRSMKKLIERRKQMKILTRELLGDDAAHTGKNKSYQTYGKGRRNIRKVINKKALSHSTVVANMEEFERKQRLSMRQTQLREILGCEDGVNVVVINDELCLEYDFEELRPVVTVHPFFTKVMKAHQYEGVKFMWDACFESVAQVQSGHAGGGCILAHCMGLGKTLQVLALLHTVLTHPQVGMQRILVCCPLSTVLNWVDEIHKWIGPVTGQIKVFELSKLKKTYERAYQLEDWYNGGGIFIIGYELFRSLSTLDPVLDCVRVTILNKIRTALLDPGPDIVICDEGHLLKNDCSVLAVAMSRVKTRRRIILTGTPMQNNLREYYCMVNFVKPSLLGSYSEYSNRFENPIMNGQHRDSIEEDIKLMKARTHILHKVLEGCLQRQEASVLYPYLPKKHEYTVFVPLTKSQRELYTHYLMNYAKETKQSVLKDFHVLQKIWTHPQVLHNFFMRSQDDEKEQKIKVEKEDDLVAEDLGASEDKKPITMETWWLPFVAESEVLDALQSSNKFLVIFRLLDECIALGDKVLIFSTSLYTMDALEYFLRRINNWSLGQEYYRLDGSVPAEVRQKWCREFNAESNTGTKLFLISTRAGSLGLNMTAANRVIILDTSWNPAHDIQSIFRVYRFGQKKDCYIYRLVAMGTMEQKIYERSVTKQAVACRVVDEQQIDRHYNMSELTELYRLDEDGSGVAAGLAAGVRDAALLRVASSDTPCGPLLYAVHEHDSLLRGSGETGLAEDERAAVWSQFQEEHANKHIQSIAMNLPKKEFDPKLTPNTEDMNVNDQSAPSTSDTKPKPKSKRGRKSLVANKNMPVTPQPSTSSQEDPYPNPKLEEAMIKKIMDILIQHNFHTTNGPQEIAELIQNVRKTVANPKRGRFRNVDPMTASIAKVLIEEGTATSAAGLTAIKTEQSQYLEQTELTETIVGTPADYNSIYCSATVDQNQGVDVSECSGRKRRRKRKDADTSSNQAQTDIGETESTETIVGTPVDNSIYFGEPEVNQESIDSDLPRRKRQRRESDAEYVPDKQKMKILATEKLKPNTRKSNEYSSSLDSADIDETITSDLPSVRITLPVTKESQSENKTINVKKKKDKKKKTSKNKVKPENVQILETQPVNVEKEPENCSESILLSDDDEPVESVPVKVPDVIPRSDIKLEKGQDNEPPIPLHKSLLTNKNFIKIVAHTYLTGNPMLDEDAANLAAEYSTLKALKELEATNKDIISGPIYDIAVQVIGRDLLKKLYDTNATKKLDETVQLSTSLQNDAKNSKTAKKKSVDDSKVVPQNEIRKKPSSNGKTVGVNKEKLDTLKSKPITVIDDDIPTPLTSSGVSVTKRKPRVQSKSTEEVVPVEMFQGPSTLRSRYPSQDECILPDDEDYVILGDPQHLPTNHVSNASEKVSANKPKVVQIVRKQPVINPIPLPPPPVVLNNTFPELRSKETLLGTSASETICLDSDEDETPVPPVKATTRKAPTSTTKLPQTTSAPTTSTGAETSYVTKPVMSKSRLNTLLENKMKVILCPIGDYESSKMVNTSSSTLVHRVPSQNVSSEIIGATSALTEPIFALEQNSPEDITTYPVIQNEKQKCLPGDIIRINKTGKVEILRKNDKPPTVIESSVSNSPIAIVPEEIILVDEKPLGNTKTPANPRKTINITTNMVNSKKIISHTIKPTVNSRSLLKLSESTSNVMDSTERVRKSYASSSDNLASKSQDPLSVLQNVVHIPADKYQANTGMNSTELHSRPTPPPTNISTEKYTIMAKSSGDLATKRTELIKSLESSKSHTKGAGSKVIDLTEIFAVANEVPRPTSTKKGIANVKMSGTSKEILINKAGTLISTAKNKPATSSFDASTTSNANTKKSVPTSSQKPAASEVGKRPSPWLDTLPYKKKKPDSSKLTLADFNLDDLDDIIELE